MSSSHLRVFFLCALGSCIKNVERREAVGKHVDPEEMIKIIKQASTMRKFPKKPGNSRITRMKAQLRMEIQVSMRTKWEE